MGVRSFKKALILGATGMIGTHALLACLRRGMGVRVLLRPSSNTINLDSIDARIERAVGDLLDAGSLEAALDGCDLLIHAAAPYPKRLFGRKRLLEEARRGMENLLEACRRRQPKAIVYVSSSTTIGIPEGPDGKPAPHSRPAKESDTKHRVRSISPYFELKFVLEDMALEAARAGMPIVVVNPTFCIDEYDSHGTTAQLLVPLARGMIPAYLPGVLNAVATRDVGEGIALAAERGRSGERYLLGGENTSVRNLLERCASVAGVRPPRLRAPLALAEAFALVSEVVAALTRTRPLFPMAGVAMSKHSQAFDTSKARKELGLLPTGLDDAIARAYRWYGRIGLLPKPPLV